MPPLIRKIRGEEGRYVVESGGSKQSVMRRVVARHADACGIPMKLIKVDSIEDNNKVWTVEVSVRGAS